MITPTPNISLIKQSNTHKLLVTAAVMEKKLAAQ